MAGAHLTPIRARSRDHREIQYSVRKPTILTFCLALAAVVRPAAAQTRDPELVNYRFVSEYGGLTGLWVNPAAQGYDRFIRLSGYATLDRPEEESWSTTQYGFGLQAEFLAFGYRHDEFASGAYSQGDAYTLVLGVAGRGNGLGVSRTWRTVGEAEGSWDIGYLFVSPAGMSLGIVWHDLGSPRVRDTFREERVVGGVTFKPRLKTYSVSGQVDYGLDTNDFHAFRIGGSLELMDGQLEILALGEWDGDANFGGFRIGVTYRARTFTVAGGAGLNEGGDARTATGAGYAERIQRRRR
jgi:hypothetical protein